MTTPGEQLPDPVMVPLAELTSALVALELLLQQLQASDQQDAARTLDAVLGRMARWIWTLLADLDEEDGYDD